MHKGKMTKNWTITPGTDASQANLQGQFTPDGEWMVTQDINPYLKQAKLDREAQDYFGKNKGFRKIATIPDIIAIEMKEKYGLDLHDPLFMQDENNTKRLRYIMKTYYPDLLINT